MAIAASMDDVDRIMLSEPKLYSRVTQLDDHLFVGGCMAAMNRDTILSHKISRIIRLVPLAELRNEGITYRTWPDIEYLVEELPDSGNISDEDFAAKVMRILPFAFEAMRNGNALLIHCRAGVSRSVAICVIVLMMKYGAPMETIFAQYVAPTHGIASPSPMYLSKMSKLNSQFKKAFLRRGGVSPDMR